MFNDEQFCSSYLAAVRMVVGSTPMTDGQFLRFNYLPIMSSPYCAMRNNGVRLLSVLKLLPIVEASLMYENDGITVKQTVAHTTQLWPHGLGMPCGSRLSRSKAYTAKIKFSLTLFHKVDRFRFRKLHICICDWVLELFRVRNIAWAGFETT